MSSTKKIILILFINAILVTFTGGWFTRSPLKATRRPIESLRAEKERSSDQQSDVKNYAPMHNAPMHRNVIPNTKTKLVNIIVLYIFLIYRYLFRILQ